MPSDNENGVAIVKRGFTQGTRCLSFRVGFNMLHGGRDAALAALRAIGGYNKFDGDAVAHAVDPFMGTGDVLWTVEVGREYSPVVYLHVKSGVVPAFRRIIEHELREAHADELNWRGDTLRAWWD